MKGSYFPPTWTIRQGKSFATGREITLHRLIAYVETVPSDRVLEVSVSIPAEEVFHSEAELGAVFYEKLRDILDQAIQEMKGERK
jgi:hypothetical protein